MSSLPATATRVSVDPAEIIELSSAVDSAYPHPPSSGSWLNYLRSRHALVWVSMGEAKLYPTFQIDELTGDIHSIVGDINADLYDQLAVQGVEPEAARWRILEWWTVPSSGESSSPVELLHSGALTTELARGTHPMNYVESEAQSPTRVE